MKYARRTFAIVSTISIPHPAPMSPMEAIVNPPSQGSRLDADHPQNGGLIPCRFTAKEPLSLDMPIGEEEDSRLSDLVEDENAVTPLDSAIQANLREATTQVLACLTPRQERILRMRFGIGMDGNHTLEEVGKQFSVTRERIRQIEAKALRKLKHPHHSRKLRTFLDI